MKKEITISLKQAGEFYGDLLDAAERHRPDPDFGELCELETKFIELVGENDLASYWQETYGSDQNE